MFIPLRLTPSLYKSLPALRFTCRWQCPSVEGEWSCASFLERGKHFQVSSRPLLIFLWPKLNHRPTPSQSVGQEEWDQSDWLRIISISPRIREGPSFLRRAWFWKECAKHRVTLVECLLVGAIIIPNWKTKPSLERLNNVVEVTGLITTANCSLESTSV